MTRLVVVFLALLWVAGSYAAVPETFTRKVYPVKHGKGHVPDPARKMSARHTNAIVPFHSLPSAFDWRTMNGVTPVKNQGRTGDCWAFAVTGAFESAILIKDKVTVSLSEQYLNDCNQDGYNGRYGGDFPIIDMQVDPGQVLASNYPFAERDQMCKTGVPIYRHLSNWAYVAGQSGTPSVEQIKTALLQYGPVVASVAVDNDFESYGNGILNTCYGYQINHMVLIVGYNDNNGRNGYWIVKNSWSTHWGEDGYIRMIYGCDQIAETAAYVVY